VDITFQLQSQGTMRIFFLFLLLAGAIGATAQPGDVIPPELPDRLVGRWEGLLGDANYSEEWVKLSEGTYEGVAVMRVGDVVKSEEHMRLMFFAGQWVFLASTGGTRITSFVRMSMVDGAWIFENREHDYPQRIGYMVAGDTLRAFIALLDDRSERMDFVLKRAGK
jgi:hypothetical protein